MAGPGGKEVGRLSVRVVPDTSRFRRQLQQELKDIKEEARVKIKPVVSASEFRREINNALRGLNPTISVGLRINRAALLNLTRELRSMRDFYRITVRIDVDMDNLLLLLRVLGTLGDRTNNLGNSLNTAKSGFQGLGASAGLLVLILSAVYPALGLIAGLLAGLPSLALAFGSAIGAIALGFDGIKEAAKVLQPAFEELKASLSQQWQDGMTPIFESWVGFMPVIQQGMSGITDALLLNIQGINDYVQSFQGMNQLREIMANSASFLASLAPLTSNLTEAFMTLGAVGSENFSYLSEALNNFGTGFNQVVQNAAGDGRLAASLQALGGVLDVLLESFNRLFDVGLTAMSELGPSIENLLTGFTDLAVGLYDTLGPVSELVGNVLGELGTQLGSIFTALGPGIGAIAEVLGTVLVGALQVLGPLLTTVAGIFSDMAVTLMNALAPAVPVILQGFQQIGTALTEALASPEVQQLIASLGEIFAQLVTALVPLVPIIADLAVKFIELAVTALPPLVQGLSWLVENVLPIIVFLIQAVVKGFEAFAVGLMAVIGPLSQLTAMFYGPLLEGFKLIGEGAKRVVQYIKELWTGFFELRDAVVSFVVEAVAQIGMFVQNFIDGFQQVVETGKQKWNEFYEASRERLQAVIDTVTSHIQMIKDAFVGAKDMLVAAGAAMIQGLIDGIKAKAGAAVQAARDVVSSIRNLFPFSPAKEGPFSGKGWVLFSGMSIGEAFAAGIRQTAELPIEATKDMIGGLSDEISAEAKGLKATLQAELGGNTLTIGVNLNLSDNIAEAMGEAKEAVAGTDELEDMPQAWDDKLAKTEGVVEKRAKNISELWQQAMEDSGLAGMPGKFVEGNISQAMSDLGMGSGSGAVPTLFKTLMEYDYAGDNPGEPMPIEQIHYHVEDIQEAMREEALRKQRRTLQFDRR